MSAHLLTARAGETLCILGNEAIVRGAIEAGVELVSGYPGTPASEIGDTFARIGRQTGIDFAWSVNEKIALETAFAAATVGARSLCFMKHLGLAYAGDPLGTIPYIGVDAGMVIVSAGDPGMVVSPNEQDQRHLARMIHLPLLDPATPAEAREMTRFAFSLSEQTGLPVIVRTTPAVAHTRGPVAVDDPVEDAGQRRGLRKTFDRRPAALNPIPVNARRMRIELDGRLAAAEERLVASSLFQRWGHGRLGVLAAGPPLATVLDQMEEQGLEDRLLVQAAGACYPLPRQVLQQLLQDADQVLVVEELTPFLEDQLRALAQQLGSSVPITGKRSKALPDRFAYSADLIADILAAYTGNPRQPAAVLTAPELPPRPPSLCPGCPHRASYLAARTVFGDDGIYFNDIGCYTLGYGPPLNASDALLAMGSSVAMAAAASRVLQRTTIAFLGDSTFFHSGMPALLDAAQTGADVVVMVLDNRITAMTGHQPSPTTPQPDASAGEGPLPEAVARGLGIGSVFTVDPYDLGTTVRALDQARRQRGTSVVVARRDCTIIRLRSGAAPPRRFLVDAARCRHCSHASPDLHCGQGPIVEHERAMVRRRVLDQDAGGEPVPTPVQPEAPCSAACPVGICVPGYVGRIAGGRYHEALALIRRRNPLPAVSSRICHRPCEKVCTRQSSDRPIAINDLKRFLVDQEMAAPPSQQAPPLPTGKATGRRVAVVGAGPSGLACALELRLRGHGVVLIDEHDRPGGLPAQAIPAHRLPREVLAWECDWILAHGIELRTGVRLGREATLGGLLAEQDVEAVYLGIGAMQSLPLGIPGDDLPGIVGALQLLRDHHNGLDIAAKGKKYLVVGGGDAAVDAARILVRLGAAAVQIVYRRSRAEMPAHPEEVDAAEEEGVTIASHLAPQQVLGGDRVTGLQVIRTEPGPLAADGRWTPRPVPGSEVALAADAIVAAIGQRPDPEAIDLPLELAGDDTVVVDRETGATSHAGVFAGGDLTPGPRTVVHAIADGRRAAYGIDRFLASEGDLVAPTEWIDPQGLSFYQPRNLQPEPGHQAQLRPAEERRLDHLDVVVPLDEEQARQEAARCLLCSTCSSCSACTDLFGCPAFRQEDGIMVIDQDLCSGCGVCVAFCPNGAIHQVEEP